MIKKTPYLTLIHDTRGEPTDYEKEKTQREIEEHVRIINEDDEEFIPHLWRKVERDMPSQITAFALVGVSKVFRMNLPHNIPRMCLPNYIKQDYQDKNGEVPLFGKITGYYLHQRLGRSFEFDIDGNFIAVHSFSPPHYGEKATIEFQ